MKTKSKVVGPLLAALTGSLLLVGCASDPSRDTIGFVDARPANLLESRANTFPEAKTGLDEYAGEDLTFEERVVQAPVVIEEAAGAELRSEP